MASTSALPLLILLPLLFLTASTAQSHTTNPLTSRRLLAYIDEQEEDSTTTDEPAVVLLRAPPKKKQKPTSDSEEDNDYHQITKPIKPKNTNSTTTKMVKPKLTNNSTTKAKPPKSLLNSTTTTTTTTTKSKLPKSLNSTTIIKPKISSNSSTIKPTKLPKSTNTTTKLLKPLNSTTTKLLTKNKPSSSSSSSPPPPKAAAKKQAKLDPAMAWLNEESVEGAEDLVSDFRDLPARLIPDLAKISTTSKVYIARANKEMAQSFKPYVGGRYAAAVAAAASCALLLLPLLLLTLAFHKLRSYLSLQRALIFIQAYLAIYFATLAVTAVATGLEPLRFFYAASPATYACMQALQTMGYVVYLLVQLVSLVAAAEGGGGRALGMAQMVVGLAVGVHYYAAVFHRAVAGEPPRANWKVHGVYALCFVAVCALAGADRRKKAYLAADDGKNS